MKLDKRFILASALVLGLGLGFQACSSDDDDDNTSCTTNADCKDTAKPVCTAGQCVAQTDKCDGKKAGDACDTGKTCQADDAGTLSCKETSSEGGDRECYISSQCAEDKLCAGGKCIAQSAATACAKTEDCGSDMRCDNGYCTDKTVKPSTCGNATLDALELCEAKSASSNIAILPEGTTDGCMLYAKEHVNDEQFGGDITNVTVVEGEVGCATNCLGYAQGTCKYSIDESVCGDGKISGTEKCETKDGIAIVKDESGTERAATCTDQNETKFAEGGENTSWWGAPKCNEKCNGMAEGSCTTTKPADEVNGIKSCTVTSLAKVTEGDDAGKIKGVVTVVAASESADVKGVVMCADDTKTFGALIGASKDIVVAAENGVVTSTVAAPEGATSYRCIVVVQDYARKESFSFSDAVVCSEDGTVTKITDGGLKLSQIDASKEIN